MKKTILILAVFAVAISFAAEENKKELSKETDKVARIDKKDLGQYSMKLLPNAKDFEKKENKSTEYYLGYDKDKKLAGYIIPSSAKGHSDLIKLLVGVDSEYILVDFVIIYQAETEEYYINVEKDANFPKQFPGKKKDDITIKSQKTPDGKIDLVSGASLSSTAITKGIKKALESAEKISKEK